MHFDGSFAHQGTGASVVLSSPTGDKLYYTVQLSYPWDPGSHGSTTRGRWIGNDEGSEEDKDRDEKPEEVIKEEYAAFLSEKVPNQVQVTRHGPRWEVKQAPRGECVPGAGPRGAAHPPGKDPGGRRVSLPLALKVPGARHAPGRV
jgi:hypothetical protein